MSDNKEQPFQVRYSKMLLLERYSAYKKGLFIAGLIFFILTVIMAFLHWLHYNDHVYWDFDSVFDIYLMYRVFSACMIFTIFITVMKMFELNIDMQRMDSDPRGEFVVDAKRGAHYNYHQVHDETRGRGPGR